MTRSTCHFNLDHTLVYCGADDGYLRALHTRNGSVLWQYQTTGAIISSVKVDKEGNLYFGSLDHYMYSLDSKGKRRWRRFLGNPIWTTPCLTPELDIFVVGTKVESINDTRSNTFALEMSTGNFVWRFRAEGGLISSPKLNDHATTMYVCSVKGRILSVINS